MGAQNSSRDIRVLAASVFNPGERLKYRVHYGFINAGEAELRTADRIMTEQGRSCYYVEVSGRSTGAFDRFVKIRDLWASYIDTASLKPLRAKRDIRENNYTLKENDVFDYGRRIVNVQVEERKDTSFKIPPNIYDVVAGYYYLRQIDYDKMNPGDNLIVDGFFDNQFYHQKIRYVGREDVKTKWGKVRAIIISPIMPANGMFDGENSIRLWISDDASRIPLKVSAELFVGSVDLDITDYSGTRNNLATR